MHQSSTHSAAVITAMIPLGLAARRAGAGGTA